MDQYGDIHPLALAFALASGFLMLILPRRAALVPLILAVVFIPIQQRIIIFTLDFFILRILVLFGWARVLLKSEYNIKLNMIDKLMLLWAFSSITVYTILWHTSAAFVNRLGISFDIIGVYFLTRFLVRSIEDILWVIKTLAVAAIPVAAAMVYEMTTQRNLFSMFGGVPEYTAMREGKLRCQGAFAHPITAGSFSASLLPLFYAARKLKYRSLLMYAGIAATTLITISTSSSGPALAYLAGILGIFMWHFRDRMRQLRWFLVISLITLHIVMKAPVWALILKVKLFGASTAYHRYHLIDQFVKRIGEWWLLGVKSTAGWGYYLFDVTNHFIRIAVDGGLITLALFIAILATCFQTVGKAVRSGQFAPGMDRVVWALGTALFVHIVSFFGVSYFDQIKVILYMLLAMIAAVRGLTEKEVSREPAPAAAAEGAARA
ncbi:MAG: hypothetical protein H3C68_01090 [Deltaproteobacteria bacterium]|nr:hypothetical protein [Deltaproteobacteria bacterium]MBZ0219151.1 hypothetical protein [Deltaproteobacteria bacterium]